MNLGGVTKRTGSKIKLGVPGNVVVYQSRVRRTDVTLLCRKTEIRHRNSLYLGYHYSMYVNMMYFHGALPPPHRQDIATNIPIRTAGDNSLNKIEVSAGQVCS